MRQPYLRSEVTRLQAQVWYWRTVAIGMMIIIAVLTYVHHQQAQSYATHADIHSNLGNH